MSTAQHIFARDVESTPGHVRALPDSIHAEIQAAFPDAEPTAEQLEADYQAHLRNERPADWSDVPCRVCGVAIFVQTADPVCTRCQRADDATTPTPATFSISVATTRGGKFEGLVTIPGKRRPVSAGKYKNEAEAWRQADRLARELAADEAA